MDFYNWMQNIGKVEKGCQKINNDSWPFYLETVTNSKKDASFSLEQAYYNLKENLNIINRK